MYVLGIDPGAEGAVTAMAADGRIIWQRLLGKTPESIARALSHIKSARADRPVFFIEHVHAMPGQGAVSMFSFGKFFGYVEMAVTAHDYKVRLVHANTWVKAINRSKAGTAKARAQETAKKLWPKHSFLAPRGRKPHQGLVDSALIAEYGRRVLLEEKRVGF